MNIDDLTREVMNSLELYERDVADELKKVGKKVTDEGAIELKQKSPEDTGDYRKGWKVKKVKGKFVVHNATNYQLTHLLENGHANVNGGRTPARVHIKPVEEKMIERYINETERILSR